MTERASAPQDRPPGPRGSFLLGSARDLRRDQLGTYLRAAEQYGDFVRFRIGPPKVGFSFDAVFSPEGAREVLATDAANYGKGAPVFKEFEFFLGRGMFTSNGERWRRHRRIAAPLFTRRQISLHLGTVVGAAADLVAWCRADADAGTPVELQELGLRYALHVLGTAIFGEDIAEAAPVLRESIGLLGEHGARRGLAPVRSPRWWPSPANRRALRHRNQLWAFAEAMIAKRRASPEGPDDLLRLLLGARDPETGQGFTDEDVRDEAVLFLVGGHETTGSAMAFTLHLLGRHPDVQDRVRAEVNATVAADAAPLDLDRLPYTTAVVNESLRLYPPAHTVVRQALTDTTVLGHPVKRGGIVAVSMWGIQHRADLWPEPWSFRPDRFLRSGGAGGGGGGGGGGDSRAARYTSFPFGGGPRACIGEHLALTELTVAAATMVRHYRLRSQREELDLEADLAVRPRGAVPALLEPLDPPAPAPLG